MSFFCGTASTVHLYEAPYESPVCSFEAHEMRSLAWNGGDKTGLCLTVSLLTPLTANIIQGGADGFLRVTDIVGSFLGSVPAKKEEDMVCSLLFRNSPFLVPPLFPPLSVLFLYHILPVCAMSHSKRIFPQNFRIHVVSIVNFCF